MSELTHARKEIDAAWRAFVLHGRTPQAVKPEILRSWQRACAEWRVDPGLRMCQRSISSDDLLARADAEEAFRVAAPLVTEFADRLAADGHTVAYVDADGVVLALEGSDATRRRLADINFAPGACWTEDAAGTNGVGTALIEARPVEVFASEHFVEAWQPWNCASVPVRAGGQLVGVVDITSPWDRHHPTLLVCAEGLARAIEARLDALSAQRADAIRGALLGGGGASGWLAVDLRGAIVGMGPAAGLARLDPAALGPALARVLARLRELGRGAAEFEQVIEIGGKPVRVVCSAVEHEGRRVGGVLRIASATPARGRAPLARRARYGFDDILGAAPALARQVGLARTAALNALPVLIVGETGTGKELFAQAIHAASDRAGGPFVALNCGSIPQTLVEAELFGYEAGAFTGGRKEGNAGKFEDADGGTLFLDEVSELSPLGQTALLRVLQEGEVTRIGSSAPRQVDVRVVAASNKDLPREIEAGRFRQDLYYRLNVLGLELPPLRSRKEDLPRLAEHYLAQVQEQLGRAGLRFSREALAALAAHDWPGNVRELKNVVERSAVGAAGPEIGVADLPAALQPHVPPPAPGALEPTAARAREADLEPDDAPGDEGGPASAAERDRLRSALDHAEWNVVQAARLLGISRRTMYRRLQKYGITRD